ncbi:MAG TPA: acyltransferase [Myxococcales bacterium]|jgi:galactoside O-acetyltransferase|nr:acyltransferase [Myxococcales bacterium]
MAGFDAREFAFFGEGARIWPLAKILRPDCISIGFRSMIDDFVFLAGAEETKIGAFVHIGSHTSIAGGGRFFMGDFSGLSGGVRIYTGNEDYLGGCLTNPTVPAPYRTAERSFVTIHKHALIGSNAVVLPGVTIGEGAVVGALSLVSKDLEPWTINVGSPAKAIRERPREKMLALEAKLRAEIPF